MDKNNSTKRRQVECILWQPDEFCMILLRDGKIKTPVGTFKVKARVSRETKGLFKGAVKRRAYAFISFNSSKRTKDILKRRYES